MNIEEIQDILEQISSEHKLVKHSAAAGGKKAFVRLENQDHIAQLRNNGGPNLVLVIKVQGQRVGDRDDKKMRQEIIVRFACYAGKQGSPDEAKNAAINAAEKIMFGFMNRLEKMHEDDDCGPLKEFVPEQISWDEIEDQPWFVNHYGFDMVFPFDGYIPAYEEEDWEVEP